MKIAIATDHRGLDLKETVRRRLAETGHDVTDLSPPAGTESADYPDYAEKVGRAVAGGDCERGVLICATGIGMSIAANKVRGVRAALCRDKLDATFSRRHNDANVLCLGNDIVTPASACEIVDVWLATAAEGGRHQRRVAKIAAIEERERRAGCR